MWRGERYLRYAQTTVADLGFAARSVGISLGPGLVDAGSCDFRCAKAPRLRSSADLTPSYPPADRPSAKRMPIRGARAHSRYGLRFARFIRFYQVSSSQVL